MEENQAGKEKGSVPQPIVAELNHESRILSLGTELYPASQIGLPSRSEDGRDFSPVAEVGFAAPTGNTVTAVVVRETNAEGAMRFLLTGVDSTGALPVANGNWILLQQGEDVALGRNNRGLELWGHSVLADDTLSRNHGTLRVEADGTLAVTDSSQFGTVRVKGYEPADAKLAAVSNHEIVDAFEQQGFIKPAPRFAEQVRDPELQQLRGESRISHGFSDPNGNSSNVTSTEAAELLKLHKLLADTKATIESRIERQGSTDQLEKAKRTIAEFDDLAFIGKPELDEAVKGIADHWVHILRDPDATITAFIAPRQDMGGSFNYMLGRVLGAIKANEDLSEDVKTGLLGRIYHGRAFQPDMLRNPKARFMFLDDWAISERSLKNQVLSVTTGVSEADQAALLSRSEVNLAFAFPQQIEEGIALGDVAQPVRVLGYFKGRHNYFDREIRVTGTHASVDYGFEMPLRSLVTDVYGSTKADEILKLNGARMPSSWWQSQYGSRSRNIPQLLLYDSSRNYQSHRNK